MKKLELKHLAPYLPYGLKCTNSKESYLQTGEDRTGNLETLSINDNECVIMGENGYFLVSCDDVVPILRPIEDLTKVIEWNDGKYCMTDIDDFDLDELDFNTVQDYISRHFDVFGLIDKGLAISYSDVQSTSNEG